MIYPPLFFLFGSPFLCSLTKHKGQQGSQRKESLSHSHQIDFIQRFMFSQCEPPTHWKVINSDEAGAVRIWSREPGPNLNQALSLHISYQLISSVSATMKAINFQRFRVNNISIMFPVSLQL